MGEFKARPTVYDGIQMRSRTEAGYAAWLDLHLGVEWEYEPHALAHPTLGQYLPDFLIRDVRTPHHESANVYIEVKPPSFFDTDQGTETAARSAEIVEYNDPTAVLAVATPEDGGDLAVMLRQTGILGWSFGEWKKSDCFDEFWPMAHWQWAVRYPDPKPYLAELIMSKPWEADWWKGLGS